MKNIFSKIIITMFVSTTAFAALTIPPTQTEKQFISENTFKNPGFETGYTYWCEGSSSGAAPTTDQPCASGSLTLATTTTSGEVLAGAKSLKISKPASDAQGTFVAVYNLDISNSQKNKPNTLEFLYSATSNFVYGSIDGVTPSDVRVYIADKTTSTVIPIYPNTLDGSGKFVGQFQAGSNTNLEVMLWVSTTNATAWDLFVDSFKLRLSEWAVINSDSDWVAYTPTFTGFGTATSVNFRYRKNGPDLIIVGTFTSGTATTTEARISFPTGLTSVSGLPTLQIAGNAINSVPGASGSARNYFPLIQSSVTYLTFGSEREASTQVALQKRNGDDIAASGTIISLTASIPIQGWTSGYATPGVAVQNVPVFFSAQKTSGSITADTAIASWTTTHFDNVGAFNSSTGIYTVKQPGYYDINWAYSITSADTAGSRILVNGSPVRTGVQQTSSISKFVPALLYLNVGDTVAVSSSISATLSSASTTNIWTMTKQASPAAFLTIPKSITYSARVTSAGVVSDETRSFGATSDWINGNCAITGTSVFTCTFNTNFFRTGQSVNCSAVVNDTGATAAIRHAQMTSMSTTSTSYVTTTQSSSTTSLTTYGAVLTCVVSNE